MRKSGKWIGVIILFLMLNNNYLFAQHGNYKIESKNLTLDELIANKWIRKLHGIRGLDFICNYNRDLYSINFIEQNSAVEPQSAVYPYYLSMTRDSIFNWEKMNSHIGKYIIYQNENGGVDIDEVFKIKDTDKYFIITTYLPKTGSLEFTMMPIKGAENEENRYDVISIEDLYRNSFWKINNVKLSKSSYMIKFINCIIHIAEYDKNLENNYISSYLFYLSSTPDAKFDLSKMNNREGSYLIICNKDNSTIVAEVEKINDKRINLIFNKSFVVELSQIADRRKRKNRK